MILRNLIGLPPLAGRIDEFGGGSGDKPNQAGAVFDTAAATGGGRGRPGGWRLSPREGGVHHGSTDGGNKSEQFSKKVFVGGLPPDIDEGGGRECLK